MQIYNVHVFREMKLFFPGIEAESPEAAAIVASGTDTCEADEAEDCNGDDFSAVVDIDGDPDFSRSVMVDFAAERLRRVAPKLLEALKTVVATEYDRDEESRNFDEDRLCYFAELIAGAEAT